MFLMLQRVFEKPWTSREKIIVFDLWNYKYNYGFEVHLIINGDVQFAAIRDHIGSVLTIEEWNKIFFTLKTSNRLS